MQFWRQKPLQEALAFLVKRHGWIYLLVLALWCGATGYVLTRQHVALPETGLKPQRPPHAALTLSPPPKSISYEVTSSTPNPITITYLDEQGQTQRFTGSAPWRAQITSRDIASAAGVTALSDGGTLTCRIVVDGSVADEKTQTGSTPSVICILNALQPSTKVQ